LNGLRFVHAAQALDVRRMERRKEDADGLPARADLSNLGRYATDGELETGG
jgi:hypothetical protein